MCALLAYSIDRVARIPVASKQLQLNYPNCKFGGTVEMRQLAKCCAELNRLKPPIDEHFIQNSITHTRVNCLISQVTLLACGKMRLPLPRYFFQTLQSTSIKLSVSPQPRVIGEPVPIPQGSQLALKVEGVLRHGKRGSLFRAVSAVCISINTTAASKNPQNEFRPKDVSLSSFCTDNPWTLEQFN